MSFVSSTWPLSRCCAVDPRNAGHAIGHVGACLRRRCRYHKMPTTLEILARPFEREGRHGMTRASRNRQRRNLRKGLPVDVTMAQIDLSCPPGPKVAPVAVHMLSESCHPDFGGPCPLCTRPLTGSVNRKLRSQRILCPPFSPGGTVYPRACCGCNGRLNDRGRPYPVVGECRAARYSPHRSCDLPNRGYVSIRRTDDGKFAFVMSGGAAASTVNVLAASRVGAADPLVVRHGDHECRSLI